MSATLTIRIDDALERELKQYAEAAHRPKGDIVREEVMPLAKRSVLLTDDDVFRAIGGTAPSERLP